MSEVSGEQYFSETVRVYVSHESGDVALGVARVVAQAVREATGTNGGAIIPQDGLWYSAEEPGFIVEVTYGSDVECRYRITKSLTEVKSTTGCTFFVTWHQSTAMEIF